MVQSSRAIMLLATSQSRSPRGKGVPSPGDDSWGMRARAETRVVLVESALLIFGYWVGYDFLVRWCWGCSDNHCSWL